MPDLKPIPAVLRTLACVWIALAASAPAEARQSYALEVIPPPAGHFVDPTNNVVIDGDGDLAVTFDDAGGGQVAFALEGGVWRRFASLSGDVRSYVFDFFRNGRAVGASIGQVDVHPVVWGRTGVPLELRIPPGWVEGTASGANGKYEVIGNAIDIGGLLGRQPLHWRNGVLSVLPHSGAFHEVAPSDVNNAGWIVGGKSRQSGPLLPWMLDAQWNELPLVLPPAFDGGSLAAINDRGQAVGRAFSGSGPGSGSEPLWFEDGFLRVLPGPHGAQHAGFSAVNRAGTAVGFSGTVSASTALGFVSDGLVVQDLGALLDPLTAGDWIVRVPLSINVRGQIAAFGESPTAGPGVLVLTPQ